MKACYESCFQETLVTVAEIQTKFTNFVTGLKSHGAMDRALVMSRWSNLGVQAAQAYAFTEFAGTKQSYNGRFS